jgi:hypothetical protein
VDPGRCPYRFPEGGAHSARDTVCSGTSGELVLSQYLMGIDTDIEVEIVRSSFLGQQTVGGDTCRLQGDVADLAKLLDVEGHYHREIPIGVT